MRNQQTTIDRFGQVVILVLSVAVVPAGAIAKSPPPNTVGQLAVLAESGSFDRILALLKADDPDGQDTRITTLVQDLERYQQHQSKHIDQQQKAYLTALDDVASHVKEGKLEEALANAIDAHDLAIEPDAMLADPQVQDLVVQAREAAAKAEADGDWIYAITLYRELDLLFDDLAIYRDKVKHASQRLRLLRLYAPQRLRELYAIRAKRANQDKPDPPSNQTEQTWQNKLDGITLSMLRQTLAQAARRHVDNRGYRPLLAGALDGLILMTHAEGLENTFASLADPAKCKRYRQRLVELRESLDRRSRTMNFLDAATLVERVMTINSQTVKLPDQVLIYEMTEGVTDTLDDFSTLIWPSDKELFSRNTQGKFYGVGIQISTRDDQLIVVSPLEDTPAQRAGINAGDVIATVDQRDTSSWTLDRAVREITGPEGTRVTLGIKRAGKSDLLAFELTRAEIVIESIRGWQRQSEGGWDYLIDPHQHIGYVRLSQFIPQSASDLDRAINLMEQTGPLSGLILDLRFNPGGLLSAAVEVSDRFISNGTIVSTVGPDGKRTSHFKARSDRSHNDIPLVVLINQGSASASEIVSGALQDYQRAVIVGTRSFGKGSVQDLFPLSRDKAYLKLTTQHYMLPKGRIIHRQPDSKTWGIEPNLLVKMTSQQVADTMELRQEVDVLRNGQEEPVDDDHSEPPTANQILDRAMDPQLEAALLVLKTRLLANQLVLAKGK